MSVHEGRFILANSQTQDPNESGLIIEKQQKDKEKMKRRAFLQADSGCHNMKGWSEPSRKV